MNSGVFADALKDEHQAHPVPTAWRQTFADIVHAFVSGDYQLTKRIDGVELVSPSTSEQVRRNIASYGETLCDLSEDTWRSSIAQWMGHGWQVLVDLNTMESGVSDLVLNAFVVEGPDGYRFEVTSVHVP